MLFHNSLGLICDNLTDIFPCSEKIKKGYIEFDLEKLGINLYSRSI